jgi:hypothetical protein
MADGDSAADNPQSLEWALRQGLNVSAPAPNAPTPQAIQDQPPEFAQQGQTPTGVTPQPQQAQQQPPRLIQHGWAGMPLIAQYLHSMITGPQTGVDPQTGQPMRPVSRGDMTLEFLGQFLGNMAQGMAASGHGPGSNIRGAAAAMTAPYQRSLQDWQVQQQAQQQQSQIEARQAQEAASRAQAQQYNMVDVPLYDKEGNQATNPDGTPATMQLQQKDVGRYMGQLGKAGIAGQAAKEVAQIKEGIQLAMPPELAAQVGIPAGTMLGKGGWSSVNAKLAAAGKNIQMGDIGNGHVGLVNKATGETVKDMGVGQYVKRAEASAYFQAKFGVVPVQSVDENGDTTTQYVSRLQAPGMAPAAHAFDIVKGRAGLDNYKDSLNRISDNLDVMNDPTQRALIAQTMRDIGTIHDPGIIASTVGSAIAKGMDPKAADLVAATLQAREFIGANRQFAGNLRGSEALYQRMVANVPGPMNSPELNRALIKQDLQNTANIEAKMTKFQSGAPKAATGPLTADEAKEYLRKAGGNKDVARKLATADKRTF